MGQQVQKKRGQLIGHVLKMNSNKHPKVTLPWTLEGVNDRAEADQKRPVLSLSTLPSPELGFISWCNDAGLAQRQNRGHRVGEKEDHE